MCLGRKRPVKNSTTNRDCAQSAQEQLQAAVQAAVRSALRHTGALDWDRTADDVNDQAGVGLHENTGDLATLLGLGSGQGVVCLPGRPFPAVGSAPSAVVGVYAWVVGDELAVAVGRTRIDAAAKVHRWLPTAAALLAWLPILPGWSVHEVDGVCGRCRSGRHRRLSVRNTALAGRCAPPPGAATICWPPDQHRLPPGQSARSPRHQPAAAARPRRTPADR